MNLNRPFKEISDTARPAIEMPMPRRAPEAHAPPRRVNGKLAITALGMVSSIGDGVVSSCAASRAGVARISALEDVQLWDSEQHELEPARGHSIPWVTEGFSGLARLTTLASQALLDLLPHTGLHAKSRCALVLAAPSDFYWQRFEEREELPSGHTSRREQLQHGLLQKILAATPLPAPFREQSLFFGEAGFLQGLHHAARQLDSGEVDSCIIGGVDSLVEPRHAEALDALGLLKGPDNPVGFLPGESAGFILLERAETALRRGARILAILDSAHGHAEPFHRLSRTPSLGLSLAKCIRDTLEPLPDHGEAPRLVIATLNGDAYRANDWGHALVRLRADKVLNHSREWYPAATFGELGAASGAAGICMGVRGLERGYVPEEKVLLWVSGDDGSRGALHLSRP
ncbi:beta-ketoacyl synthase N-terminal-like domain-containing protein [Corallococcus terminator]